MSQIIAWLGNPYLWAVVGLFAFAIVAIARYRIRHRPELQPQVARRAGVGAAEKPLVIFIHGFGSSARCWDALIDQFESDPEIIDRFELRTFEYPTAWVEPGPLRRIPRVREVADLLKSTVDTPDVRGRQITLVGHSLGGLVILKYLSMMLREHPRPRIRQVILIATPIAGSTTLAGLREVFSIAIKNPQEEVLRVLADDVKEFVDDVRRLVTSSRTSAPLAWPIPVRCFYGLRDNVVTSVSASGPFDDPTPLDGDHFTVLHTRDRDDPKYQKIQLALCVVRGLTTIFEVESIDTRITVRPTDGPQTMHLKHGRRDEMITFDNLASLRQDVVFAAGNTCQSLYHFGYRTRSGQFVKVEAYGAENRATSADRSAYDDYGFDFDYRIVPEDRQSHFHEITVYGGFSQGDRSVTIPLNRNVAYYARACVTLDLKRVSRGMSRQCAGPDHERRRIRGRVWPATTNSVADRSRGWIETRRMEMGPKRPTWRRVLPRLGADAHEGASSCRPRSLTAVAQRPPVREALLYSPPRPATFALLVTFASST